MEIDVRADVKEATRYLSRVQKRAVPYAQASAMNFVAERSVKAVNRMIPQVFSDPIPFSRNAVRHTYARFNKLKASVLFKDISFTEAHYLQVHTDLRTSGVRPQKRSEKRLGGYWVQGKNAKTNRFGNLTGATYAKMLADIGRFGMFLGDPSNTKNRNKMQKRLGSKKLFYMTGSPPNRIIMKRVNKSTVTPWLVEVVKRPTYRRRLPMNRITQNMVKTQFRRLFDKQMKRELAKAEVA